MTTTIVDQALAAGLHRVSQDNGRTWKWGKPDRNGWPSPSDGGWPWKE